MKEDINKSVEQLRKGGVILYPTDTIWGLGCDACNEEAVKKIYDIKQRENAKSMLVLVDSINMIERYVNEIPSIAYDILEVNEEPLTIIYPKAKNIASNLIAPDGSIAIRITNEKFSSELIYRFRKPIVSTSANISGMPSPQSFYDIDEDIINLSDYVVKYRQSETYNGKPSGIIKIGMGGEIVVVR